MNSTIVQTLLDSAKPFLRITGVQRQDWCRNVEKGARRGPWRYQAVYEVLDQKVWSLWGEVLYMVEDAQGTLRMVGQSSRRLKDRWRVSPMFDLERRSQIGHALFHSTAWPAIERAFDDEAPPFTVRAVFRDTLERLQREGAADLVAMGRASDNLAEAVEKHLLATVGGPSRLWNRAGVGAKGA